MYKRELEINCSGKMFKVLVDEKAIINPKRICKKLLKEFNKNNNEQKKHNSQNGY